MKKTLIVLAASLTLLTPAGHAAQTAQARMFCSSLRFQRGWDSNHQYYLDLTTLGSGVNGELTFQDLFSSGYSHSTYLNLVDDWFEEQFPGAMAVDVPSAGDANGNGFDDFFEVSQSVNGLSSSGAYSLDYWGNGDIQASWYRGAGSSQGTCVLQFKSYPYYTWLTFTHTFELLEYKGPLSYTPGSNTVSGSVNLTQTGNPANQMGGPVQFAKVTTNRFNMLTLQAGAWTNAAAQTLTLFSQTFYRDILLLTNYYGYVEFLDGDPNTTAEDYWLWTLSIDDLNDADHDGIPDFSDDPQVTTPRRPLLSLARGSTNLLLTIRGDAGHVHQVQEIASLSSTNWQTVLSTNLTSGTNVVSLPLPSGPTRFWRVLAQ